MKLISRGQRSSLVTKLGVSTIFGLLTYWPAAAQETVTAHQYRITALAVAPSGELASAGGDGYLRIWGVEDGKLRLRHSLKHGADVVSAAFSANGRQVVGVDVSNTVRVWDAATGQIERVGRTRAKPDVVIFHPDSVRVVYATSGPSASSVTVWNTLTDETRTFPAHHPTIRSIAIARGGDTLISGGTDGRVRFWTLTSGKQESDSLLAKDPISVVRLNPGETRLAVGTYKELALYDMTRGHRFIRSTPRAAQTLCFSPQGNRVAVAGDGQLNVLNSVELSPIYESQAIAGRPSGCAFVGDDYLATAIDAQGLIHLAQIGHSYVAAPSALPTKRLDQSQSAQKIRLLVGGTDAVVTLAKTFRYLANNQPELIKSTDPSDEAEFLSVNLFTQAVNRNKLPRETYLSSELQQALVDASTRAPDGSFYFPSWSVQSVGTLDTVMLPRAKYPTKPYTTAAEQAAFCIKQGWKGLTARAIDEKGASSCVKRVLAPEERTSVGSSDWEVLFSRPAFVVEFGAQGIGADDAKILQRELPAALRDKTGVSRSDVRVLSVGEPRAQISNRPGVCAKEVLGWPQVAVKWNQAISGTDTKVSIFDPSVRTESASDEIKHPYVDGETETLEVACKDILVGDTLDDDEDAIGDHAVAVASVIYGMRARFLNEAVPPVTIDVSGFLVPRGEVSYRPDWAAYNLFDRPSEERRPGVWLLPFQGKKTVTLDSPLVAWNAALKAARIVVEDNNVNIISAPEARPADAPTWATREGVSQLTPCIAVPYCLGASPLAMVIAPLDSSLNLWSPDSFLLDKSFVWLAAPGNDVLTASLPLGARPQFRLRSGASFAAPVVAAVALALQSERYRYEKADDVMARIASTADLDLAPSHVRFGRLRADRALEGADKRKRDMVYRNGAGKPDEAVLAALSSSLIDEKCGKSKRFGTLMVLAPSVEYRRNGAWVNTPQCIPMEKVLRIVNEKAGAGGVPSFTIVHWDVEAIQFRDDPSDPNSKIIEERRRLPRIIRNAVFAQTKGDKIIICDVTGQSPKAMCIYERRPDGTRKGVNLVTDDLVLSPFKMRHTGQ
jgi:hypothetical protein